MASPGNDAFGHTTYERQQPEQTLLYQLIKDHYPGLVDQLAPHDCMDAGCRTTQGAVAEGKALPEHVHREFEAYLKCGRLEHGFLRVRCDKCHFKRLAWAAPWFSCKKRVFCPSCGARRMAETAALLADDVFPMCHYTNG